MSDLIELDTPRLRLRQWRPQDREPFARLNADPRVMQFLPSVLSRQHSDALADRFEVQLADLGWGVWAVEEKASGLFIGCIGLHIPAAHLPVFPSVEVLWRLAFGAWGKGYATEAARAALTAGFEQLQLPQVVAFTSVRNARSRAVMERLGMQPVGNFDHPDLPDDSPLQLHCLYRIGPPPKPDPAPDAGDVGGTDPAAGRI